MVTPLTEMGLCYNSCFKKLGPSKMLGVTGTRIERPASPAVPLRLIVEELRTQGCEVPKEMLTINGMDGLTFEMEVATGPTP